MTVDRLYAELILSLSEECYLELLEFQRACKEKDLEFFNSSLISFSEKKKVLDQIGFSKDTLGFLYQLTLKKRWPFFNAICDRFLKIMDQGKGILKGTVWTSQTLADTELKKIEQTMTRFFKNKKIQLCQKQRKDLVRGLRVEVGGFSFDDSILYHFNQFKEQVRNYGNSKYSS